MSDISCGIVQKARIFLNVPKSCYRFFLLLSFSQVVGSLYLKCVFFPPFCGCESKCNLFLSCSFHFDFMLYSCPFMILSFCIIFLSCSFHVPLMFHYFLFMFLSFSFHVPLYNYIMLLYIPFMFLSCSFHLAFMSLHFPSLCIKHTSLRKVICSNRSGGYQPKNSRFHHISLSFLLSCCYRLGGLCRLPSSGFMNMYMYKFVIVFFFTLIVFWAVNALVVLRGKQS